MNGKPKKAPREKDLTSRYFAGRLDEDRVETHQRFSHRSAHAEQDRILRTALMRSEQDKLLPESEVESLPTGRVVQVFSLFSQVEHDGRRLQCVVRKTLNKTRTTAVVVGDTVRFREIPGEVPTGVIEQVLPRKTVLTRTDSFAGHEEHVLVANAQQMLVVISIAQPPVKWGLVDRMIIAAQSGKLEAILCMNKIDLAQSDPQAAKELIFVQEAVAHYAKLGIRSLQTSAIQGNGLDDLKQLLAGKVTVLAGHSGVGKSSLIRAVQPQLDLRVGAISGYTGKGRHTTASARMHPLDFGGVVVDTPGVKQFGLWGVGAANLAGFFPDIADQTAPPWRIDSFERIARTINPGT